MTYQPRYIAYSQSHGNTPDEMLKADNGMMHEFIIWTGQQWRKWETETGYSSTHKSEQAHTDFDEWLKDPFLKMRSITVNMEDGNEIHTSINGTRQSVKDYYIGQSFDFGDTEEHPTSKMVKATDVIFHDKVVA